MIRPPNPPYIYQSLLNRPYQPSARPWLFIMQGDAQLYAIIKLMRFSYYEHSPDRVNPEFVGIASKYSDHKRKRLNFERRRRELDSDVLYTAKLDGSLEKALENKLTELGKLQQARQRHQDHIKYKQELEERRQAELQLLKEKNTQSRVANKTSIEQARNSLRRRNKINKEELELDLSRLSTRFEQFLENKLHSNAARRSHVQEQKRQGQQRVDCFHRERNKESLNAYLSKIKKERSLRREHNRRIRDHEHHLQDLSRTVEVKKQCLDELQNEIYKYKTDLKSVILAPQRSRKYTESNKSESRFIPAEYSAIIDRRENSIDA